jgi:hypothetical protein
VPPRGDWAQRKATSVTLSGLAGFDRPKQHADLIGIPSPRLGIRIASVGPSAGQRAVQPGPGPPQIHSNKARPRAGTAGWKDGNTSNSGKMGLGRNGLTTLVADTVVLSQSAWRLSRWGKVGDLRQGTLGMAPLPGAEGAVASRNQDTAAGGGGTTPGPPWVGEESGLSGRLEHEQFQEDGLWEKRASHLRSVYRGRGPERLEILA